MKIETVLRRAKAKLERRLKKHHTAEICVAVSDVLEDALPDVWEIIHYDEYDAIFDGFEALGWPTNDGKYKRGASWDSMPLGPCSDYPFLDDNGDNQSDAANLHRMLFLDLCILLAKEQGV